MCSGGPEIHTSASCITAKTGDGPLCATVASAVVTARTSKVTASDLVRLTAAAAAVRAALDLDGPAPLQALSDGIATALSALLGTSTLVYRPSASAAEDLWRVDFVTTAGGGWRPTFRADLEALSRARRGPWGDFDPLRPDVAQRNTVLSRTSDDVQRTPVASLLRAHGMLGLSELRMLVCDGPMLLAWIGGYRRRFDARDARLLLAFGRLTRRTLRLARALPAGVPWRGVEAVLDALETDAFLVRADGRIEVANRLGARRLASDRRTVAAEIAASFVQGSAAGRPFDRHPFGRAARRSDQLFLLTRSASQASMLEQRVASARERWRLTPRQTMVVRLLATGDANKDVATKLRLSIGSVERHVTSILRKARAESRLALVARLWTV